MGQTRAAMPTSPSPLHAGDGGMTPFARRPAGLAAARVLHVDLHSHARTHI